MHLKAYGNVIVPVIGCTRALLFKSGGSFGEAKSGGTLETVNGMCSFSLVGWKEAWPEEKWLAIDMASREEDSVCTMKDLERYMASQVEEGSFMFREIVGTGVRETVLKEEQVRPW